LVSSPAIAISGCGLSEKSDENRAFSVKNVQNRRKFGAIFDEFSPRPLLQPLRALVFRLLGHKAAFAENLLIIQCLMKLSARPCAVVVSHETNHEQRFGEVFAANFHPVRHFHFSLFRGARA
jgi:hypothetical protein